MSSPRTRLLIGFGALAVSAAALTAQSARQRPAAPAAPAAPALSPASDFKPDTTFSGSTLAGWHAVGDADWKAQNGELIGTPRAGGGGWLVLDKSYEDVYFFSRFQCQTGCKGGLLFRLVDAPGGGKTGVLVSLDPADLHTYKITIDAQGKETSREPLTNATAFTRIAPAPGGGRGGGGGAPGGGRGAAPAAGGQGGAPGAGAGRGGRRGAGGAAPAAPAPEPAAGGPATAPACTGQGAGRGGSPKTLPTPLPDLEPPAPGVHGTDWNTITVSVDADVVRPWLNGNIDFCGANADNTRDDYGPVALYAGGTGAVHYKDVSFKDLNVRVLPKEIVSPNFHMQRIDDFYYAWGTAVADFNKDGALDIAAGPWIYYGPGFTTRQEMYIQNGGALAPSTSFATSMVDYTFDFNNDGWPDVLAGESRAMHLYVNPKGEHRHWKEYYVLPQITSEAAVMADLDKDGRPEVVFGQGGAGGNSTIAFASYDPANPAGVPNGCPGANSTCWPSVVVSDPGLGFGHSIGVGDINGDGRPDILQTAGWWEQPKGDLRKDKWVYHPVAFGRWGHSESAGGAEIMVYDVNGDKLNDVVTGLNAHGFGLAWFEQKRDAAGNISFVRHMIMDDFSTQNAGNVTFSEMHASNMGDMDGDGIPDYVTGKRVFSHQESYVDADPLDAQVLYVFHTVRDPKAPGGARFRPELVHNRSGVGSEFTIADVNKDGVLDIVTSTNRGTFLFTGVKKK